jgi:hypothetical protein
MEQVVDHCSELVYVAERIVETFFLVVRQRAHNSVEQYGGELPCSGKRRAQLVGYVREELILEANLLSTGSIQFILCTAPLDGISNCPLQGGRVDLAFDQVVDCTEVHCLQVDFVISLTGQQDYRGRSLDLRSYLEDVEAGFAAQAEVDQAYVVSACANGVYAGFV